jgi:hypothetical protein
VIARAWVYIVPAFMRTAVSTDIMSTLPPRRDGAGGQGDYEATTTARAIFFHDPSPVARMVVHAWAEGNAPSNSPLAAVIRAAASGRANLVRARA